jgi:hypothetical protein
MCLMGSDPAERGGFYPPGLGLLRTQLLFPVSNELVIIGAFEIDNAEIDADDLLIAQINGSIILHSTRQIYARDSDFLYKMQHNAYARCFAFGRSVFLTAKVTRYVCVSAYASLVWWCSLSPGIDEIVQPTSTARLASRVSAFLEIAHNPRFETFRILMSGAIPTLAGR